MFNASSILANEEQTSLNEGTFERARSQFGDGTLNNIFKIRGPRGPKAEHYDLQN